MKPTTAEHHPTSSQPNSAARAGKEDAHKPASPNHSKGAGHDLTVAQKSDDGEVPCGAAAEQAQAEAAVTQMGANNARVINEGGRTNDSHSQDNPPRSVGAVPTPAIRGTWR